MTSEVLHSTQDKTLDGLPREHARRSNGAAPRQPALWASHDVYDSPAALFGQFPKGFIPWAARLLRAQPDRVLHVCSGAVESGIRIDLRRSQRPSVVADGRALPLRDDSVEAVLIDPPYTVEYADQLYGTDYPRPSHLLREAARVVRPGGRVGILHFLVPMVPPGADLEYELVRGVTTGAGYRIRALTVFRRGQESLPGLGSPP